MFELSNFGNGNGAEGEQTYLHHPNGLYLFILNAIIGSHLSRFAVVSERPNANAKQCLKGFIFFFPRISKMRGAISPVLSI